MRLNRRENGDSPKPMNTRNLWTALEAVFSISHAPTTGFKKAVQGKRYYQRYCF